MTKIVALATTNAQAVLWGVQECPEGHSGGSKFVRFGLMVQWLGSLPLMLATQVRFPGETFFLISNRDMYWYQLWCKH